MKIDNPMAGMIKGLLKTFAKDLENVQPSNNLALFVSKNIETLFEGFEVKNNEFGFLVDLGRNLFVKVANDKPDEMLNKLVKFNKAFEKWAKSELETSMK